MFFDNKMKWNGTALLNILLSIFGSCCYNLSGKTVALGGLALRYH